MPVFPDLDRYTWFEAHTETIIAKCKRTATSVPGVTDRPFVFYVPGKSPWSDEIDSFDEYQSGGYWPQMIGHVAWCIAPLNMDAACQLACDFIDHTRDQAEHGAPFEWLNPAIPKADGRWYGPSATLPLEAFRRISSCG